VLGTHHDTIRPFHPVTSRGRASVGFNGLRALGLAPEAEPGYLARQLFTFGA
jgi:hypothetical protein